MSYQPKRLTRIEVAVGRAQWDDIRNYRPTDCAKCCTSYEASELYRCYYCHQWFCEECMGKHLEGGGDE